MSQPSASTGRQMLKGTVSTFLAEALILPTGLLTAVFLTRQLGPEDYGLLTLMATLVAWVEWSITSIFVRTTIKFVSEAIDWKPIGAAILQLHLVLSIGAALLLWGLSPAIASFLNEPSLALFLPLFVLDIPLFSLARAHRNIMIGAGDYSKQAFVSSSRWISRLILIVVLVELGFSLIGAVLGNIGASVIELLVSRFFIRPSLIHPVKFPFSKLWGYAVPLFFYAMSTRLYDKLDLILLKALGGTIEQTGIYGAAQNLSLVPGIFALSFCPLLLSTLNRARKDGELQRAKQIAQTAMRVGVGLMPFAAMTAGASHQIIELLFGPRFLPAAPVLAWLMFGAIAQVMISVTTSILTAADKPSWTFALTGPLIPVVIISHWLLIPKFGMVGAACSTTVVAGIGSIICIMAIHAVWQVGLSYQTVLRCLLVCGVAYGAASFPITGVWIVLQLAAISAAIPVMFFLSGELSASEVLFVRSSVSLKLKR